MKPTRGSSDWFKGAFILTVGALITKILSAVYRVPFQNIVGDVGFYIYQQVYPFFGIALALSTYGFPVIISKHFSELRAKNQAEKAIQFLLLSFFVLYAIGIISFLLLYYGSSWLALQMDDPNLSILFKVISVVFLIMPIISIIRGYFQGMGNMVPTAVSQVAEQLFRVMTILTLAILLINRGYSLYIVGGGAAFGSITGGLVAILILILFFLKEIKKHKWSTIWTQQLFFDLRKVFKILVIQGFAVCISSMIFIFMQLSDSLNMLSLLVEKGIRLESAKELKGIYDRGQPLIQLGSIVATSMSLSLVPLISSERIKANKQELFDKIRFAIQTSLVIGAAASVGLLAIIRSTNEMLYENQNGSSILAILTFVILISSVTLTVVSILQGLEVMFFPAWIILLSFAIKYGLNISLIPFLGAYGAALATIISLTIGFLLLWWRLKRRISGSIIPTIFLVKVVLASLSMFIGIKIYQYISTFLFFFIDSHRLFATIESLSSVVVGGMIYIMIIMRTNVFRFEDIALLPFGSKMMFLLPNKKKE
ncbi:putative polysaccharide biosynthesis protein [Neobacillus sp. D3-1R]|uniref:putative polysaccharide biosynthesis protein n=1 Tax=Neobacillus sp. D3-1R TaxID=3445778 RepID=UPI003FA0E5C3